MVWFPSEKAGSDVKREKWWWWPGDPTSGVVGARDCGVASDGDDGAVLCLLLLPLLLLIMLLILLTLPLLLGLWGLV